MRNEQNIHPDPPPAIAAREVSVQSVAQGAMLIVLAVKDDPVLLRLAADFSAHPQTEQKRLRVLHRDWAVGLKWLLKLKWGFEPEDFSARRKLERGLKPFGNKLFRLLELCYQLHPSPLGRGYGNAIEWFQRIAQEWVVADARMCLDGDPDYRGKRAFRQEITQQIRSLRNGQNPIDKKGQPHTWALFEAALRMSPNSIPFRREYWIPFLEAWEAQAKSLDSPDFKSWDCRNGVMGRGQPKRCKKRGSKPLP